MTTSNAPVRYSHTMRTSQSRRRSKPRIVTTGHEPDDKDNDGFKRVVGLASSGHVTCPGSLSTKTPSIFYSNWHEEFRSQPEVYLSKQPAPARASRYKPYPHRSYVSVKHFTDRHQRLMPQIAQPSARQGTSAIFSFTREKSPSMAVVLDDDFQVLRSGIFLLFPCSLFTMRFAQLRKNLTAIQSKLRKKISRLFLVFPELYRKR